MTQVNCPEKFAAIINNNEHKQGGASEVVDGVYVAGSEGCTVFRIPLSLLYPKSPSVPGAYSKAAALWSASTLHCHL
jgi:hypothetical protein